ncbi:hypothetical protein ONZ45_g6104 [Pleurotus djamor]|nr:hypothetical protein ONZ45_g6104 [Pleurotus djamor]
MTTISDSELYDSADRVKGKVALITGAASGIGREAALLFAKHGALIVIGDRDVEGADRTARDIQSAGGEASVLKCDVTQWSDQVALFEFAIQKYGSVDIVLPNAGIAGPDALVNVTLKDGVPQKPALTTLDVNLTGVMYSIHLALHYFKLNRVSNDSLKALVLIGSMGMCIPKAKILSASLISLTSFVRQKASWTTIPGAPQYTASKHAVLGTMRALYPIISSDNIRIGSIHPFYADTNILSLRTKLVLAGIPKVPVSRIAGAILHVATRTSPESNGSAWLLTDDGPVFQVPQEQFKEGVYKLIDQRANRIRKVAGTLASMYNLTRDLWRICGKQVSILVVAAIIARALYGARTRISRYRHIATS